MDPPQFLQGIGSSGLGDEIGVDAVSRPGLPGNVVLELAAHGDIARQDKHVLQCHGGSRWTGLDDLRWRRCDHVLRDIASTTRRGDRHAQNNQSGCWHLSEPSPWQTT